MNTYIKYILLSLGLFLSSSVLTSDVMAQSFVCPAGYTCTPIVTPIAPPVLPPANPIVVFPGFPTVENCYILNKNLSLGSVGADVSGLQQRLEQYGFHNSKTEGSGYFGPETLANVKAYQRSINLPSTGFVGPMTREALNRECVASQKNITVTSPNGGEIWKKGTTQNITWRHLITNACPVGANCADSIMIAPPPYDVMLVHYSEPRTCSSLYCPEVADAIAPYIIEKNVTTKSYSWYVGKVTAGTVNDGKYKISVCASGTNMCDFSDSYFTISSQTTNAPYISSIAPVAASVLPASVTIYGSNFNSNSKILINGASYGSVNIVSRTSNSITFNFPKKLGVSCAYAFDPFYCTGAVPPGGYPDASGTYSVSVANSNNSISNSMDFRVGLSDQNNLTVTSPNGGEIWKKGTTQNITWRHLITNTCPVGVYCADKMMIAPAAYDIMLVHYSEPRTCSSTSDAACQVRDGSDLIAPYIIEKNIATKSYSWYVGKVTAGTVIDGKYKISVCASGTNMCDFSDSYFTISSQTTNAPYISSIAPSLGVSGTSVTLYGSNFARGDSIRVSGKAFEATVYPTQSSQTQLTFKMPNLPAYNSSYDVQVSRGGILSNQVRFTNGSVNSLPIALLAPNGGETWLIGSTQNITWKDDFTSPDCPIGAYCMMPAPRSYSLKLSQYKTPCPVGYVCTLEATPIYEIAGKLQGRSYSWKVGDLFGKGALVNGLYNIEVCEEFTGQCDTSDRPFTISSTVQPPVVGDIDSQNPGAGLRLANDVKLDVKYLSDKKEDRAGQWQQFSSNGNNDYVNRANLYLNSSKTIKSILFSTNYPGRAGFTSLGKVDGMTLYPAVVTHNGRQLNNNYDQTLGTYGRGSYEFFVYDESTSDDVLYDTFALTFYFTDGTYVTAKTPGTASVTPVKPVLEYKVITDKTTYTTSEKIKIRIAAANNSSQAKTLNWTNGCQVSYSIANYYSGSNTACITTPTSVTIAPYSSKTWELEYNPSSSYGIQAGTYKLVGTVIGYGEAATEPITITSGSYSDKPYISSVGGEDAGPNTIDAGGKVGIQGTNLAGYKGSTNVYIGGSVCTITKIGKEFIECIAPSNLLGGNVYDLYINTTGSGGDKVTSNIVKVRVIGRANQPSITVTSPNGGEIWNKGVPTSNIGVVRWSTENIPSTNNMTVRLRSVATGQELLSSNNPNIGYTTLVIPSNFAEGRYTAEVKTSLGNISYMDASDSAFTISSSISQPSITVLYPNGNGEEKIDVSKSITVKLKSNNAYPVKHYINIVDKTLNKSYSLDSLLGSSGVSFTQEQINQPNQSISVLIPESYNLNKNNKYRIEICVNNICDESDASFSIFSSLVMSNVDVKINGKVGKTEVNFRENFTLSYVSTGSTYCRRDMSEKSWPLADGSGMWDIINSNRPTSWSVSLKNDRTPGLSDPITIICYNNSGQIQSKNTVYLASSMADQPLTASLRANGEKSLVVRTGDSINYTWESTGGISATSNYTTNNPSKCGGPGTWVANNLKGNSTVTAESRYDGCVWNVNYVVRGTNGQSLVDTMTVSQPALTPPIVAPIPTILRWTVPSSPASEVVHAPAGSVLSYSLNWLASPTAVDQAIFVHFVDSTGQTKFLSSVNPAVKTTLWSGNVVTPITVNIPANTPPGTYKVMAGLYNGGIRLPLITGTGVTSDSEIRYRVGTLVVDAAVAVESTSSTGSASVWNSLKSIFTR